MRKSALGAITGLLSMSGILLLTMLHNYKIIYLAPYVVYPLVLASFYVTLMGFSNMFKDAAC